LAFGLFAVASKILPLADSYADESDVALRRRDPVVRERCRSAILPQPANAGERRIFNVRAGDGPQVEAVADEDVLECRRRRCREPRPSSSSPHRLRSVRDQLPAVRGAAAGP
jgi:hypothetical protein